ncbi:MAG: hypothetical protein H6585_13090 [Flavobacteriales bacterium]|nr:hypothetical protein [Flavobacteriales bacterium]MCB9449268.1 hypothetical protein [Flavobacteriales bacterium]
MKRTLFFHLLLISTFVFLAGTSANAQRIRPWGLGPEVIYNYSIKEIGLGGRAHLYMGRYIFFSPEITFFPGFNKYKEMYVGAGVHYNTTPDYKWGFYGMMHLGWNRWFNYDEFITEKAKPHNLAVEPGIGMVLNRGCLRPFGEARYNWKWHEGSLRIGVIFLFKYCQAHEFCPPAAH